MHNRIPVTKRAHLTPNTQTAPAFLLSLADGVPPPPAPVRQLRVWDSPGCRLPILRSHCLSRPQKSTQTRKQLTIDNVEYPDATLYHSAFTRPVNRGECTFLPSL